MNTVYIPPVWERDPLGVSALKLVAFSFMMLSVGAFISIWGA